MKPHLQMSPHNVLLKISTEVIWFNYIIKLGSFADNYFMNREEPVGIR